MVLDFCFVLFGDGIFMQFVPSNQILETLRGEYEMKIGTRVIHKDGSIGSIEAIDNDPGYPTVDVRLLTPNNEPSACICTSQLKDLTPVSDNVVPMQRNKEWWKEAKAFCSAIENALNDAEV